MDRDDRVLVSVQAVIGAPVDLVWKKWTSPEDIKLWNNASEDWHTPDAYNDLRIGGRFSYRMEARDGSAGFDFGGIYDNIIERGFISYTLGDGRKVSVTFSALGSKTGIVEAFETENINTAEMQRAGWQSILDNFKKYTESVQASKNLI